MLSEFFSPFKSNKSSVVNSDYANKSNSVVCVNRSILTKIFSLDNKITL